jgi:hypothetical protein
MNVRRNAALVGFIIVAVFFGRSTRVDAAEGAEAITLMAIGDDDSDVMVFDHVDDPMRPTRLRFVGIAQNRQTDYYPIGITLAFVVPTGDFSYDYYPSPGEMQFQLPEQTGGEFVSVPIDISFELPYSPDRVGLFLEGYGPGDLSVVEGTFYHSVVPEPTSLALAATTLAIGIPWLLRRRQNHRRVSLVGLTPFDPPYNSN